MTTVTTITGPQNIHNARVLTLRAALRMEVKGMTRRGRSVYSIVKEEFKFRGSKQKVLDQLNDYIKQNIVFETAE